MLFFAKRYHEINNNLSHGNAPFRTFGLEAPMDVGGDVFKNNGFHLSISLSFGRI